MQTPQQPRINLLRHPNWRENYCNSVQIRLNVWDFFMQFGTIEQPSADVVDEGADVEVRATVSGRARPGVVLHVREAGDADWRQETMDPADGAFTARLSNARANNAVGFELDVITIALLGGISVFGGRGRLTGVLWALVLVATIRNALGLSQVGGDAQGTVIGLLLIVSLLASNAATRLFDRLRLRRILPHAGD